MSLMSPAKAGEFFTTGAIWKLPIHNYSYKTCFALHDDGRLVQRVGLPVACIVSVFACGVGQREQYGCYRLSLNAEGYEVTLRVASGSDIVSCVLV